MTNTKREWKTFIVEDEAPTRELLVNFCLSRPELKLSKVAKDGEEALEYLLSEKVDLAFFDINLPLLSGLDILERLEAPPYIIFITALRDKAIDAFEMGAIDYLLKPFSKERFYKAVDRAVGFLERKAELVVKNLFNEHGLFILEKENHFLIPYKEINYISSRDNFSLVHTDSREYVTYKSLKSMESKLPPSKFLRIYKQYIINLEKLSHLQSDNMGNYIVYLKDEEETQLPVGRKYISKIKELLE
ncbi:LytR/AlgR family response regulator transcription factor [Leptospira noguchii]|uniref:LytTr DNA-binding domain protein n=1 Tax=Leptospira noguchii serovar Autumnalis str. ZUN142 TaxID=1085540 RepID=M6UDI1_9LEPT|nr:LytTR family DNA-binding domain-containing protein [Leptospira noguchii]EMO28631.1 LytTr DNA-binding domain protein [Leptospira interrogans serovar Bataviae str. HAI135]EKR72093.1 LytTr DNA-binding domain protein [Leptospira noguchii str. 2006001870]EMO42615.1 LytTr DNA-binding domain protein [Leptospira noguchii serovar Autumnalis str. ZUN142]EMS88719.1 LytTr DNA-binding domain protein [Leptospira noguchii str. Hook]UOG43415.1 LytTR family DNA-binding domain-containing protein [Leptospira 